MQFFTVFGPAGRLDMAYIGFTNKLLKSDTIQIYNYGNCRSDFTYADDIVEGIVRASVLPSDFDFDENKQLVPMWPVDVPTTYADSLALERDFGFRPRITLREGLRGLVVWNKEYYNM